jgi:hypothetical protein
MSAPLSTTIIIYPSATNHAVLALNPQQPYLSPYPSLTTSARWDVTLMAKPFGVLECEAELCIVHKHNPIAKHIHAHHMKFRSNSHENIYSLYSIPRQVQAR